MASFNEEVYETNSIIEDRCSLVDEGYWYENDLLLAAELGKTLLERNRDLETQLNVQTKNSHNLRMEIDLLKKQLETLRELNRNKMILYEDVDKNSHDLEVTNRNLICENKKQKEKIQNIVKKNSYLEQNIDEYSEKLNSSEKEIEELRKLIYTHHSNNPSNTELKQYVEATYEHGNDYQPTIPTKCKKCKDKREKISMLELEIEMKSQENEELRSQLSEIQKRYRHIQVELEDLKCLPQQTNKVTIPNNTLVDDLYSIMEYDIDRVDEKPVEVGSLDTGGKVFTSENSLKTIGAETTKKDEPSSLLIELDEKYNNLVRQYETLLNSSRNREENSCKNCSINHYTDDNFQKKLNNIFSEETRRQRKLLTTEDYRPKYKELFRDAFDILKDMKQSKSSVGNSKSSLISRNDIHKSDQ